MFDGWHFREAVLVDVGVRPAASESVIESALFADLRAAVLAVWADPSWMGERFQADVARVLDQPAGPGLMSQLASLGPGPCPAEHGDEVRPTSDLPTYGSPGNPCLRLLVIAAAWQACAGYAVVHARIAVVDAVGAEPVVLPQDGRRPEIADPSREELAAVLRLSPGSARVRIDQARDLAAQPDVAGLVARGVLPDGSAVRICEGPSRLDPLDAAACGAELAHRLRARISRGMRPWTGTDAADCSRRLAVKTASYRAARKRAVAHRNVSCWSNGDGTSTLNATLPELAAERVFRRLTAIASGIDGDPRTMDARRADLLIDLVLGTSGSSTSGVELNVIIDAACLLGLASGVAEVPGMGPVPAELVRELAGDASWRAWIRDATGAVTATGTTSYQPTAAIARLVRAREPHCRMAGCRRPASSCDLDHAIPWPDGLTTTQNLGPLCRRHHNLKTHVGWQLNAENPDHHTWTTPAGNAITDQLEPPWREYGI